MLYFGSSKICYEHLNYIRNITCGVQHSNVQQYFQMDRFVCPHKRCIYLFICIYLLYLMVLYLHINFMLSSLSPLFSSRWWWWRRRKKQFSINYFWLVLAPFSERLCCVLGYSIDDHRISYEICVTLLKTIQIHKQTNRYVYILRYRYNYGLRNPGPDTQIKLASFNWSHF